MIPFLAFCAGAIVGFIVVMTIVVVYRKKRYYRESLMKPSPEDKMTAKDIYQAPEYIAAQQKPIIVSKRKKLDNIIDEITKS